MSWRVALTLLALRLALIGTAAWLLFRPFTTCTCQCFPTGGS